MNRQRVIISFILLLVFTYAQGQDKIITIQRDTIYCKIVSISLKFMKYEQESYNHAKATYSIPMEQVREYSLGLQPQESLPATITKGQPVKPSPAVSDKKQSVKPSPAVSNKKQSTESFERWRIGLDAGGSYLLKYLAGPTQAMVEKGVSPSSQADIFYKRLRKGMSAGGDIHYMFNPSCGIGVKYSLFYSSTQIDYDVNDVNSGVSYPANEKGSFTLHYVGPSFLLRQWLDANHKFRLNEELSLGYVFLRNEEHYDANQYLFTNPVTNETQYGILTEGKNFSGFFQLSFEYYPAPWLSFGVNAGITPVVFRSLNVRDNYGVGVKKYLGSDNYFELSHLDYSLGLRFHF